MALESVQVISPSLSRNTMKPPVSESHSVIGSGLMDRSVIANKAQYPFS